jgi:pimeloyl-ACP methyl ester carboxylesterase
LFAVATGVTSLSYSVVPDVQRSIEDGARDRSDPLGPLRGGVVDPDRNACHSTRIVGGVNLEFFSGGQGQPLLLLHDYELLNGWWPFMEALSQEFSVLAPSHPGFGQSDLPDGFDSVDDLAYLYLDLLAELEPTPAHVVGMGFGGWIAAEMAVRCSHKLQHLVLVDALGIKVSDRTTSDIVDTFVIGPHEFLALGWHDAEAAERQMKLPGSGDLSEEELVTLLRNRQSAALFGWKPFMHNPKLCMRLSRVGAPTMVVWGASDRIVRPHYGRAYAEAIPGAEFRLIQAAGHYPYLEQPDAFVEAVLGFIPTEAGLGRPRQDVESRGR